MKRRSLGAVRDRPRSKERWAQGWAILLALALVALMAVPAVVGAASQQVKLTASDAAAFDHFGHSVAVSGDTAVVGAFADDIGANEDQGSAYVFTRTGSTWTQQAKLTASDGTHFDDFGVSVALSGDTAVVGAPSDDPTGSAFGGGSAYVFTRTGSTWTQQAKLTGSQVAEFDGFGWRVALSGDTAVVGAPFSQEGAHLLDQGAAYVFTRTGSTWAEQAKLTASDATFGEDFGRSVAVSGDTAVIGAPGEPDDQVGSDQGSAYAFTRTGSSWTQQAKLTASDGAAHDGLGRSVAVSGDTAVVGAFFDDVGANLDQGSAYAFTRTGSTWSQQAKLTASDGASGDDFGASATVDGDTAVVGAVADNVGANFDQGSAYVFTRTGSTWTQPAKLTAADGGTGDGLGGSVAVSGDTAVIGAPSLFGSNNQQGGAYVFTGLGPNNPPSCNASQVTVSPAELTQSSTRSFELVSLGGGSDPDGDPVALKVTGVTQDEPVASGGYSPDAVSKDTNLGTNRTAASLLTNDPNQVYLRRERLNGGDGRVHRIAYTGSDGRGGTCSGGVKVVSVRRSTAPAIDSAPPSYNSFVP